MQKLSRHKKTAHPRRNERLFQVIRDPEPLLNADYAFMRVGQGRTGHVAPSETFYVRIKTLQRGTYPVAR